MISKKRKPKGGKSVPNKIEKKESRSLGPWYTWEEDALVKVENEA